MSDIKKKLFFIAVTDQPQSANRKYADVILKLLQDSSRFNEHYNITAHYQKNEIINLDDSLKRALLENEYTGYIILLDCFDKIINENVMFEFGAVMAKGKPFAVISQYHNKFPFDIEHINIDFIDEQVMDIIRDNLRLSVEEITDKLHGSDDSIRNKIDNMFRCAHSKLQNQSEFIQDKVITNQKIYDELAEIKKMIKSSAEYIDGEENAFRELTESVYGAKHSLRTSRFANQSIVKKPTNMQREFMNALYDISKRNTVKNNFERIICNNSPLKWFDIQNILLNGSNDLVVYVRKENYSIHFELVIIDEEVAFIHFYQSDHVKKESDREVNEDSDIPPIEKINSTVKIKGPVCKRLANIFDRLHHRDIENRKELSRTLLGLQKKTVLSEDERKRGYFRVNDIAKSLGVPMKEPDMYDEDEKNRRKKLIIEYFKKAFKEWDFNSNDKFHMLVGIALLEKKPDFIHIMKKNDYIKEDEQRAAIDKFNKYQDIITKGEENI